MFASQLAPQRFEFFANGPGLLATLSPFVYQAFLAQVIITFSMGTFLSWRDLRLFSALDTFFDYVDILNDNELNEKNLSSLFSEKFSISMIGNPNLTFQNISDFTKSWNAEPDSLEPDPLYSFSSAPQVVPRL